MSEQVDTEIMNNFAQPVKKLNILAGADAKHASDRLDAAIHEPGSDSNGTPKGNSRVCNEG
jgi:hypothetical protein